MNKQFLRFNFFLLMCLTLPLTATGQVVSIPDPNLRAAIETTLGKAAGALITADEMATLTHLEASNTNIIDLTGLKFATNLTRLELGPEKVANEWRNSNSVKDLSPLTNLTQLTRLKLWGNSVSDLSPLSGLTNLTKLWLGNNHLSDISPVLGLINLTGLGLEGNRISDISALSSLTQLKKLWLGSNSISDISALSSLTQLTELQLDRNNITDLSPLVANTGLGEGDTVYVRGNPLSYTSIKTHIPTLLGRGVTVEFDDTTHLNVGAPRAVRMIYFLPNDHPYRADVVQRMKDEIRTIQTFYAEQMEVHGYGEVTFHVETDLQGEPMVHRVDGQHPNSHYYTPGIVGVEIAQVFNFHANLYFIAIDTDVLHRNDGRPIGGEGARDGKIGGFALFHGEFSFGLAAHELGHGFGLWHDFRDGAYIMSYGSDRNRLSACHAEYLAMHPYFNPDTPIEEVSLPIIELISPRTYSADSKSIPVRLKVSDSEGLHQVLLVVKTIEPHGAAGSLELKACRGLSGKKEAIVEFEYDGVIPSDGVTSLSNPVVHPIHIEAVDTGGNVTQTDFVLFSEMLQPLSKISGDNQHSLPNTPLPVPFVIEVRDLKDGFGRRGVSVMFAVTAGGGTLSVTRTTTDENGRAESTLTLGPNLGTNTVEVSAAGIEQTVIFNAVAGAGVDIPDPNLRAAIATILGKALGDPIARAEMATLTHLEASNTNIIDLTGLKFATNLTRLELGPEKVANEWRNSNSVKDLSPLTNLTQLTRLKLWGNSVSDLSPLSGLTNLTKLWLGNNHLSDISPVLGLINLTGLGLEGNRISDISALSSLTQLKKLWLGSNSISDISALSSLTQLTELQLDRNNITDLSPLVANTGLGEGDTVYVRGNPLSYTSIKTHIPALQSRGAKIEFDNRTLTSPLKISGDDQQGTPGTALERPFVVEVRDASGSAFEGVPVTFTVTAGGGTLSVASTTTDKNGRAESTLTLGPNPGTNTVTVSVTGIQAEQTFTAEGIRIPLAFWIISGDKQQGLPGAALDNPFVVEVRDQSGDPLLGVKVAFSVASGGGTLSLTSATTDSNGRAESTLTLGPNLGTNTVSVSVTGIQAEQTFTAEGIRIPKTLEIISGKDQEGLPGEALAKPFVVEVRDRSGEPLLGVKVTFSVSSGGGTLSLTSATTDSSGRAESTLTLGPKLGTNTVTVSVTGIQEKQSVSAMAELPAIPQDVNRDDVVNILDLVLVASDLGDEGADLMADVNGDGVVNILDLVLVAGAFGDVAAPASDAQALAMLTAADVGQWLAQAQTLDLPDTASREGVLVLEQLLAVLAPKETILLPNYPNPFNPETWIPYQLAENASVTLTIYDTTGALVRRLDLGHRLAGYYTNRGKAAHWDGRNESGEPVASGVYFYQLATPSFRDLRRMVILK